MGLDRGGLSTGGGSTGLVGLQGRTGIVGLEAPVGAGYWACGCSRPPPQRFGYIGQPIRAPPLLESQADQNKGKSAGSVQCARLGALQGKHTKARTHTTRWPFDWPE